MAEAWTSIPNGDVAAGAAVTTALMTALRDNPEGMAAGVSGAPRIKAAAHGTPATGANRCGGIRDALSLVTPATTAEQFVGAWNALASGVVRVNFSFTMSSGTGTHRIYKNGSVVTSITSTGAQTYDLTVAAGDHIECTQAGSATGTATLTYCYMTSDLTDPIVGA